MKCNCPAYAVETSYGKEEVVCGNKDCTKRKENKDGKMYIVTYIVCGTHHHFGCFAKNKSEAKKICIKNMGITAKDIVDTEEDKT